MSGFNISRGGGVLLLERESLSMPKKMRSPRNSTRPERYRWRHRVGQYASANASNHT